MTGKFEQKKSLKTKLFLSFIPVIIFLILFILYSLFLNTNLNSSFTKIDENFDNLNNISRLSTIVNNKSNAAKNYVFSSDKTWVNMYNELLTTYNTLLGYISTSENFETIKSSVDNFKSVTKETQQNELSAITRMINGDKRGAQSMFDAKYEEKVTETSNSLYKIIDIERDGISTEINNNLNYLNKWVILGTAIINLLILTLLLFVYLFTNSVLKPIEKLATTAKNISDGDMASRAEITDSSEIGALADNFNTMVARLESSHLALSKNYDELKVANEKLKKIDQMKSDFITITAHQLRTPLTGIKWSLTAIMNGDMGPVQDKQKEYLKGTVESNQRMIDTVNDILKMDNFQTGDSKIKLESVNLTNLFNNVLLNIYPQATHKKIKISLNINKNVPPLIKIDKEAIRTALQNLLENSIFYTNEKGIIEIKIYNDNGKVIISITDNGIGIPEGEKKYIFTKFFRATNAINKYANGSGLGLVISKNIIQQHGGEIDFTSKENEGTTFYISLPVSTNLS
jgi:signal transduction histidine kinase